MELGTLCHRKHEYKNTGKSMRTRVHHGACLECEKIRRKRNSENPVKRKRILYLNKLNKEKHKDKVLNSDRRYKKEHKEDLRKKAVERYHENIERSRSLNNERRLRNIELYRKKDRNWKVEQRKKNPQLVREKARKYYKENTVKIKLRTRLYKAMKMFSETGKTRKSDEYGINYEEIIKHLGKCPGSQKDWHIDHIRPLSSFDFNDTSQIRLAFSPENHQWLPALKNLSKGKKITWE